MDFNTNLDWLSKEFVLEVISKDTKLDKRDLFVKKYYTKPATKTGENFSSYMHRLYVNFTCPGNNEINKTFIVKVLLPKDSDVGIIHNDLQLFKKEVQMYDKNITIVNEMLGNYYPGFKLSPDLIHVIKEPYEIIVLEDLMPLSYKLVDKQKGLDYFHCKIVLNKLAKYHAISMILNKQDPNYRKIFNKGAFYDGMPQGLCDYFKNGVSQAIGLMKTLPECERFVKIFQNLLEKIIPEGIETSKPIPENVDGFFVLNHGDFWIQNMMFKYDRNGHPIDVLLIDWQMVRFHKPGNDLNYFFFTSCTDDCRNEYRDDLLKLYISTLRETLIKFNYSGFIPNFDDLNTSLYECRNIAMMTPCIVLPLVKINNEISEFMSTEGIMDNINSNSRNALFSNLNYQKALIAALEHLEKIGFLQ